MTATPSVPAPRSEADQTLDHAIAAAPIVVTPPPSDLDDPAAHRRGMQTRGW